MAQSISTLVPARLPEPLAARSPEGASASSSEEARDFGSHLAAEKPVSRPVERPLLRRPPAHANRDVEDAKREAARDAPRPANADQAPRPQALAKDQARAPADHADEARCPQSKAKTATSDKPATCDKPDVSASATPEKEDAPVKTGGENPVCDKGEHAAAMPHTEDSDTPSAEAAPTLATPQTLPSSAATPQLLDLAAESLAIAGNGAPFAEAAVATLPQPEAAIALALAPTPVTTTPETASSIIAAISPDAASKAPTSVPPAGARDVILPPGAEAVAKPDLAGIADNGAAIEALAETSGKATDKGDAPEAKAASGATDAASKQAGPRSHDASARHSFADWVNEFASTHGALHRSGDLVGALDRAVAGQAPAAGGADALRPTPLQVLPIEIGMQAARGATRFQIRLDPAELGRVDVQLDIRDNGEVHASLVVDRVETLALLKRDASTLQYAFEQAGLKQAADGLTFSLRGEGQNNQNAQREGSDNRRQRENAEPTSVPNAGIAEFAMRRVMIPNSSVDRVV